MNPNLDALEQAFNSWIKDQKLRSQGGTPTMLVEVAVGLWFDPMENRWKCYAEGWERTDKSGDPKNDGARMTIIDNGLNNGETLYWRTIRAEVPLPVDHHVVVTGHVDPGTDP